MRWDPNEDPGPRRWFVDAIAIRADDESPGAFTVELADVTPSALRGLATTVLVAVDGALVKAHFAPYDVPAAPASPDEPVLREGVRQLQEHFAGERTEFDLPLAPPGTAFQRRVWDELRRIPYGTTTTYGELALRLGDPRCVRAVGLANGRNP
ncbi:MAG: methylated-DNA--[protein]-cysteine S-methyltransferase, partial [Proteobacteria bacterium]|nr:methylated-DNA--[protein]-cysteine S-methyltransferase [Pseudomonadota bacterium]